MTRLLLSCLVSIAAIAGTANGGFAETEMSASQPTYQVKVHLNVQIPMRDGVNLAADIYRPDSDGKFPVLLMRTYWGKHVPWKIDSALFFAKRGYIVVLQDVRGRFDSGGVWTPYVNEVNDGYDTQQWLGQQKWCDGNIGMFGISYDGFTQLEPAPLHSPYVKALIPMGNQQTNFGHLYNDGVLQLGTVLTAGAFMGGHTMQPTIGGVYENEGPIIIDWDKVFRRLPLITALDDIEDVPWVKGWIRHDQYDDYWASYGVKGKYRQITTPAYFVTGWYDNLLHEEWRNFTGFREQGGTPEVRQRTRIIIGPWQHGDTSLAKGWDRDFGPDANLDRDTLFLGWFDSRLKGMKNGLEDEPPIRIFVMGANTWRWENEWPLARTKWTNFYLSSDGKANSLYGDGTLSTSLPVVKAASDKYTYDPDHPVPTLGGQIAILPDVWGARDRRPVERRDDVLVYTTAPLSEDMEVTGPVSAVLYASSSAVDTDFTATLSDVYPDGRAIHICEGIRGARFRESLEHPTPIVPGQVYKYEISLWETSNVFKAGHRIRVDISSSDFPRYARNQNTGNPFGMSAEVKIAQQTILHDAEHPSHLVLPVIPASSQAQ